MDNIQDKPAREIILIIDDNPANLRLLTTMLLNHGYQARPLLDGTKALKMARNISPDLILLDINMPILNGYEVCKQLKADEKSRDIPVIFISALQESLDKVKAFSTGGIDYITKPFQLEEVLARVQTHLALRKLQQKLQQTNVELEERVAKRTRSLVEERNLLRTLIDNLPDYVYVKDTQGRHLMANNMVLRSAGATKLDEIVGKTDLDIFPLVVAEQFHRDEQAVIESGQPLINQEDVDIDLQTGDKRWLSTTKVPFFDSEGNIAGIVGMSRDITSLKRAEQERLRLATIDRELTLAQEIQGSLLPSSTPGWTDLDVVCHSTPAREVGGDLYAYHAFDNNGFAIVVGDVSGKGIPAALFMALSLASIQAIIGQDMPPAKLLAHLDRTIVPYTRTTHQNCAMVYTKIIPPTAGSKEGSMQVANSGCIAPIIRRVGGLVEWVEIGGTPLGVGLGAQSGYQEVSLYLAKEDIVILTSDGVVEAKNAEGKLFGFKRLEQAIAAGPNTGAEAMLEHLKAKIAAFTGEMELHDDMTMVVVRV